jgi:hypothetical protein
MVQRTPPGKNGNVFGPYSKLGVDIELANTVEPVTTRVAKYIYVFGSAIARSGITPVKIIIRNIMNRLTTIAG